MCLLVPLLGGLSHLTLTGALRFRKLRRVCAPASPFGYMRQVSTDIAHDLKTPLNRLGISLEEARRKLARGQSAEDEIDAADAEVQQINGTSEALLRIAQIE